MLQENKIKNALAIVAHPDDETIWMGGAILKNPDWEWTIFSLCRKNDSDRILKFQRACKFYGARAIITDLEDVKLMPLDLKIIKNKIIKNLPSKSYDYLFTHGKNGEYGHIRHKEVHKAVKELIAKKEIDCKKLYLFSYKNEKENLPVPTRKSDFSITLNGKEFEKKKKIITDIYGFDEKSFEAVSCNKTESFKIA